MTTITQFKKKFWIKTLALAMIVSIFSFAMIYLLGWLSGEEIVNLKYFAIFLIIVLPLIPLLATKLYSVKTERIQQFNELEDKFENIGDQLIINVFGEEIFEKLYRSDLSSSPTEVLQVCKELLSNEKCKENNELTFYIYVKMAKSYFRDSSYQSSIEYLKKALSMQPHDFYTNFRIAQLYEMVSEGELAVNHYETSTKSPDISPGRLQQHVYTQINRVKTKGPNPRQTPQGFKWLTG